ncbi:GDSL-type esterase/lipase family protein [Zavarzinella formosa]|uniref:GDSL-type esterase/lipase family protein n=1 Tax=Zavarzinella formosa TaxID=360055 RepID=UPI0002F6B29F|nr:GDSL-type esterase/lipase family protein [Zavarzinella formosa]
MKLALLILAAGMFVGSPHCLAENTLITSMDELRFQSPKEKATAQLVDGKVGKAIQFKFEKEARSAFFTSNVHGTPEWDKAAGFSFWVKGDGSSSLGGLQFIYNDDYAARYDVAFPIKQTEWTKISVAWSDLIPVLPDKNNKPLGGKDGNQPSKLSGLWIGKWWYWGEYPACSFAIDDIRLEPTIERPAKEFKTDRPALRHVRDLLKAGKPVSVVTMGDSLTDTHHWANRKVDWPSLLKEELQKSSKSEITIINPAIGGTQLRQNLVLMPRWLEKTPKPDLVTICFGGNDWDAGMRGEEFFQSMVDAVNRIQRATDGHTDVLILTTVPGATRWETTAELAEACRKAAKDRNVGLADLEKAFHVAGKDDPNALFVNDRVHLSTAGHRLVADSIFKLISPMNQK